MTDDKRDILHLVVDNTDDDEVEVFKAHHIRLQRCDCGCETLQMLACDDEDHIYAVIGHLPQQWLDICRAITNESIAMLNGEDGHVGYPPKPH